MIPRILMVIAPEDFRDEELLTPRKLFTEQGWHVETVSTREGVATGMLGAKEKITATLADIQPEHYDAIVVVGGMGSPSFLWHHTKLHHLLQTMMAEKKVISAICLSGAVLAIAGLLEGKKATVWEAPESLEAFKEGGATYTGEPVTVDGKIVTGYGPDAAEAFAQAVIAQVKSHVPAGA